MEPRLTQKALFVNNKLHIAGDIKNLEYFAKAILKRNHYKGKKITHIEIKDIPYYGDTWR
jgi:hypothetical protein